MNASLEFLAPAAERIAWTLLHSLWQGAAVAIACSIALHLLRRQSAALRHAVCMLGLLATSTAAFVTAVVIVPRSLPQAKAPTAAMTTPALGTEPAIPNEASSSQPGPMEVAEITNTAAIAQSPRLPSNPAAKPWRERLAPVLPWISGAWMLGVLLLSVRHCGGWWRMHKLRRGGAAVGGEVHRSLDRLVEKLKLRRGVRLLQSADAVTPMLTGVIKPVIILPLRALTGLGPPEIEAVLAHELAHFVRRDAWSNLLQVIVETMLFYHPAIWWMGRRARIEREHAADDLALRMCTNRRVYAGALVRLAELEVDPAFALAATGGHLLARIRRILSPQPPESAPSSGLGFGIPAFVAILALGTIVGSRAIAENPPIQVAPGESIQAAINKAPPGSVIQLPPGEWTERIVIAKPLTLEGSGWGKTTIRPNELPPGVTPESKAAFRRRYTPNLSSEEQKSLDREWNDKFSQPTLLVRDTGKVTIRKLRLGAMPPPADSEAGGEVIIAFRSAGAKVSACAVVGPAEDGIAIQSGSDVEIAESLVTGLRGVGISVEGSDRSAMGTSRLRLSDSEVRRTQNDGIYIGADCDGTIIERCRISDSAQNGIHLNSASPTIIGNSIFRNRMSGIRAFSKTGSKVTGNLLWNNGDGGISCWHRSEDRISHNTFVENRRSQLTVIGGSKPEVSHNIFVDSPVAIACWSVGETGAAIAPQVGAPILTTNLFWKSPTAILAADEKRKAPTGSLAVDPKFRAAGERDFSLGSDSPARLAKVGVAEPLALTSPWPLLAEEKAILRTNDAQASTAAKPAEAATDSKRTTEEQDAADRKIGEPWIADAFQLDDAAKRTAAIERIRKAMSSSDVSEARAGIKAFVRLGPIEFDKASFRPIIRGLLASSDPATRAAASGAFTITGTEPDDLPRIFALADDPAPEVREGLTFVIVQVTNRDLTGKAASDAALKLMEKLPRDSRSVAHALWGSKFSPEIEAKVLDYCRDMSGFGVGYTFFYGALSTQANKSEASVKRLIEILADQDTTNKAGRAIWGLRQGVDRAQFPLVADAMVKVIEARSDGNLRSRAIECLASYGSAAQAPAVKAILAKPGVTGELRKSLEQVLAGLESRPVAETPVDTTTTPAQPATTSTAPVPAATGSERAAQLVEQNRRTARIRAAQDRQYYNREQLSEIETLYQVANTKGKRSEEAKANLKILLEKYDKSNRTGCGTLYLGQASEGEDRLRYLTMAVEKYSDCYYFNGCQVGGYGRYVLALTLWDRGDKDKARKLLSELKTTYKDATDHSGRPIGEVAEAVEKELEKSQ